jgi:hypothetical protein
MVNFNENLAASSDEEMHKLFTSKSDEVTSGFFAGFPRHLCFCPTWPPRSANGGHVLISSKNKHNLTSSGSRLSYLLFVGEIKKDAAEKEYQVLHRCGYGACINPWHLYLGTTNQNGKDRAFHRADKLSKTSEQIPINPNLLKELGKQGTKVYCPNPLALSRNKCYGDKSFTEFQEKKCMFAPWLSADIDAIRLAMWQLVCGGFSKQMNPRAHVPCTCQSERCINPNHLKLVLPAIGREGHSSITHNRKMTPEKIAMMRQLKLTNTELGKLFGVHFSTIIRNKMENKLFG